MFTVIDVYLDHLEFCVVLLVVKSMSVVVNVMLSLMSVMNPTSCLVQPIGMHGGDVMYFGGVCLIDQQSRAFRYQHLSTLIYSV